jgi:PAS domain S-box-containing protein
MVDAGAIGIPVPAETSGEGPRPGATYNRWSGAVIDLLPDLVAVVDSTGLLLYANAAAEAVLGYAPETELGRSMFELVHPEDLDSVTASFLETVATPGAGSLRTFRMRSAEGDWRHVETTVTNRLADPSVAGVVVNVRDVTDRVRAEVRADRLMHLYRVLALSHQATAGAADVGSMYKRLCDLAVIEGGFSLVSVAM